MKKLLLGLASLVLVSCAVKLATPTQTDVDRMQSKYTNYTLTDLSQGKSMYEQHCAECHKLKNPTKFTEKQWEKEVPAMVKKYNKKFPDKPIDASTQDLILKYVITMNGHK